MAVLFGLCFSVKTLEAQMIESADPVPSGISAGDLKELEGQKNNLDSEFQEITSSIQEYNTFCLGGMSSMNALSCEGRYSALTGRMSTYQASLVRYRSAISKATKKSLPASETLTYDIPEGWFETPDPRERWTGPDPTAYLRNGRHSIGITHYGLENSQFKTPEDFVRWIKNIFEEFDSESSVQVAGKAGTLIKLHYDHEGYTDHHGAMIPPEYVYEEFLILPAEEGFWALIFSFRQVGPVYLRKFEGEDIKTRKKDLREMLKDWDRFLKTCQF